jgi:hypothetical protein
VGGTLDRAPVGRQNRFSNVNILAGTTMKSLATTDKEVLPIALKRLRTFAGFLLLLVGTAGLVRPFVPGAVLILAGITLVGTDHPWLAPIVGKVRGWLARHIPTKTPRQMDSPRKSL